MVPLAQKTQPVSGPTSNESPGVQTIATADEAKNLADKLGREDRESPVVVVTHATDEEPYLDAERMAKDLKGLAKVYLLRQGQASWAFTGSMPARLGVFGGAARVYPIDLQWLSDETRAPLFFCWEGRGAERITTAVIEEGLSAAHRAGLLAPPAASAHLESVEATVLGPMADFHVLLELPDGRQCIALAAALKPGVPANRLVSKGQLLRGYVSGDSSRLTEFRPVAISADPRSRVREAYNDGDVVLVRVLDVGELSAKVALHPDVEAWLVGEDNGPSLNRLLDSGDVLAVQVHIDDNEIRCSLPESDAEAVPAVSVIPGGPPWLTSEDLVEVEEEVAPPPPPLPEPVPVEEPASLGVPDPSTLDQYRAARQERALLDSRLAAAESELASIKAEAARLRRSLREANQKAKQSAKRAQELDERAHGVGVFSDPNDQLRHEIWLQYLNRIPEPQRVDMPLAHCTFGPNFLDSIDRLEGISREKVVDVLVEVLTGLVRSIQGRQLHQWRTSVVGPQEQRADDAKAWRVSLQVNTPSARRLKYWQLPGGGVEFDSVGVHDEGI